MSSGPTVLGEARFAALAPQAPALGVEGLRRKVGPVRLWSLATVSLDATMVVAAWAASLLGAGAAHVSPLDLAWTLLFGFVGICMLASRGMYRLGLWTKPLDDLAKIGVAFVFAGMAVVSLRVLLTGDAATADAALRQCAFAVVYVGAGRVAFYWSMSNAHARGDLVRRALVVGAGRVGTTIAERLLARPQYGLLPVAFLDDEPLDEDAPVPVIGGVGDLAFALERSGAEHVIVTFSRASDDELLALVNECERRGVGVSVVPRLFEKVPERIEIEHLGGLPLVTAHPTSPRGWQFMVKYAIDRIVAAVILLLVSPIMGACALAVRISMGRPLFFEQIRVGRDGKPFGILKFRSMRDATPAELELMKQAAKDGNAPGGVEGVDRRTKVGTFLRKTSLDELPQLFNVLKGEMSLVGPRPERPEFVEKFEQEVYRYGERHRCKAGITGWAQVHGLRGKTSIADRAEWDNYYIENFSLTLDLKILFMTLAAVIGAFRDVE